MDLVVELKVNQKEELYTPVPGQLVDFEPKGTDTVPAMLTPGEFVVNADASRKHLDILKAINKSKGGRIGKPQYLQNGGRAGGEGYCWRSY